MYVFSTRLRWIFTHVVSERVAGERGITVSDLVGPGNNRTGDRTRGLAYPGITGKTAPRLTARGAATGQ